MQPGIPYFSRINPDRTVTLPKEVADHLEINEGDSITFSMDPERPELGMIVSKTSPEHPE